MAASKSVREALNTLNDELLTAKLTAVAFNNLHADIEASLPPPRSACLGLRGGDGRPPERASEALEVLLRQGTASAWKTWKTSPGRSKPGLGNPPVSRKGVCRGRGTDRATLKTTSGAMVAVLRWSRETAVAGSAIRHPSKP
jgi:hypothetical protein